jgi:Peptidase family M28
MKRLQLALAVSSLLMLGSNPVSTSTVPVDAREVLNSFSKSALRAHMDFLADDLLEGRGTGTRGQEIAAHYLAAQFEAAGLDPGGDNNSEGTRGWFQMVPMREVRADKQQSSMYLENAGQRQSMEWGVDCLIPGNPLAESGDVRGEIVFVGFGVVAKNRNYDDYAGTDVRGKIVAMLQGAPASFPASERAHFSSAVVKLSEAAAHGAIGTINVRTPQTEQLLPWARSVIGAELPTMRWLGHDGMPNDTFPEIKAGATLSVTGAEKLFAGEQASWKQILEQQQSGALKAFPLHKIAAIHAASVHRQVNSPNVIGILRGSDPQLRDEFVIYSAHTDHLGIGRAIDGDSIYNGAVDDASGCTALIEMARAFARLPKAPARSILFAGFTGEEKGLLGADYFAHQPTVPSSGMAVDLNMDGASVFYTFKDFVPLGIEHTTMEALIERDLKAVGVKLSPDPMPEQVGFIRNDQYPFVKVGVPALSLGEGLEAKDTGVDGRKFVENWIATRYHSPSDDLKQPLNFNATVQYMQVAFLIGYDLAQQRELPAWKPGDFFGNLYGRR